MGSMEQMPLEFTAEESLERLSTEELKVRYTESVGYEPGMRFIGRTEEELREIYLEGIRDKEAGLQRLSDIDAGDNGIGDAWGRK